MSATINEKSRLETDAYTLPSLRVRMRRLRSTPAMLAMMRENFVHLEKLIYPLFVVPGHGIKKPIKTMPGIFQRSIDEVLKESEQVLNLGLKAIILFGIPESKDSQASGAYSTHGIVQKAIRELKRNFPELIIIADTCLCEYMDHGHCGVINQTDQLNQQRIVNDQSLELLCRTAVSQAEAGADIIAPSDMMDGRVAAIRAALDGSRFEDIPILAYSAKFASALYGPFREAALSAPQFGDRTSYQMNPANSREAVREIELDIAEGADIIMVKPALPYLDIINIARRVTNLPIAAYNVSGEYSMVKAATANGWIDEKKVVFECLTSIARAGADLIITYHAKDVAQWLS